MRTNTSRRVTEQDEAKRYWDILERLFQNRGVFVHEHRENASVDLGQLSNRRVSNLRVTAADVNGTTVVTGDIGKFWFVPGYSAVDGPDVVRP